MTLSSLADHGWMHGIRDSTGVVNEGSAILSWQDSGNWTRCNAARQACGSTTGYQTQVAICQAYDNTFGRAPEAGQGPKFWDQWLIDHGIGTEDLLELIARISLTQPQEAFEIWQAHLHGVAPDYPEEPIQEALRNLVASGDQGRRDAHAIVDEYIRQGKEMPLRWLQEIVGQSD